MMLRLKTGTPAKPYEFHLLELGPGDQNLQLGLLQLKVLVDFGACELKHVWRWDGAHLWYLNQEFTATTFSELFCKRGSTWFFPRYELDEGPDNPSGLRCVGDQPLNPEDPVGKQVIEEAEFALAQFLLFRSELDEAQQGNAKTP
jgi:hypothetical protein